ncbi:uncharacterized protein [Panulirus ornatus]|uniref:uncharacterized protein n=1 Tax=Panulirus ornatus TaxID=150431 RepID=UPI003A883967
MWVIASPRACRPSCVYWFFLIIVLTRGRQTVATDGAASVGDARASKVSLRTPEGNTTWDPQSSLAAESSTEQHRHQGAAHHGGRGRVRPEALRKRIASVSRLSLLERYGQHSKLIETPAGDSRPNATSSSAPPPTHEDNHLLQEQERNEMEQLVRVGDSPEPTEPADEQLQSRAQTTGDVPAGPHIWNNLLPPAQQSTSTSVERVDTTSGTANRVNSKSARVNRVNSISVTVNRVNSKSATVNRVDSKSATVNRVNDNNLHDSGGGQPVHARTATRRNDGLHLGVIAGLGNPGSQGAPVSLGYPSNYLVPMHDEVTTPKPPYNSLGEDLRLHHQLLFGSSFNGQTGQQQLVPFENQIPGHVFPNPSYNTQVTQITGGLWAPPQVALSEDPGLQDYLSRLTTPPRSSSSPTPVALGTRPYISGGVTSFFYPTGSPLQTVPHQHGLQNDAASPDQLDVPSNPDLIPLPPNTPFIPALSNIQHASLDSDLSASLDDGIVSPVPATLSSSSTQNCFSSTLCILTLATVLALGLTTAFVSPFFGPGLLGRRKRSIDYVVLSEDSVAALVNYYATHLTSEPLDVPASMKLLFKALHDPADTSTTRLLARLKHLTMNTRNKLSNITKQEGQSKDHTLLPDDALDKPKKRNFKAAPKTPGISLEGEAWTTPVSKQETYTFSQNIAGARPKAFTSS